MYQTAERLSTINKKINDDNIIDDYVFIFFLEIK